MNLDRPSLRIRHPDGRTEDLPYEPGVSLMQAATLGGVDGLIAECGGNCMCATCHVYVEERFLPLLPPMRADEDGLLDGTASERRPTSRLSCQIPLTAALDGLVVTLPERQV